MAINFFLQKNRANSEKDLENMFGKLSGEALSKNADAFLKLAEERLKRESQSGKQELDSRKELIDQVLKDMKGDLGKVQDLITNLDKDRKEQFGKLDEKLKSAAEQTSRLQETTTQLSTALAGTKARGQWGERMAEDVLRMAGFIEGINYRKQKSMESSTSIPDFTFLLPQNLIVNMDVKFPLDNYMKFLNSNNDTEKEQFKKQFLKDVKARIKEVTSKDYINPRENTVDYVLVFIPNEQVYAFINEHDRSILDDALKSKVILCSPLTLYAILAVIRQAVDNFNLEKTGAQILSLLGTFKDQWSKFTETMKKMGDRIASAQKEYDHLITTRSNQLEKPLQQIDKLRKQTELESDGKIPKIPEEM